MTLWMSVFGVTFGTGLLVWLFADGNADDKLGWGAVATATTIVIGAVAAALMKFRGQTMRINRTQGQDSLKAHQEAIDMLQELYAEERDQKLAAWAARDKALAELAVEKARIARLEALLENREELLREKGWKGRSYNEGSSHHAPLEQK